MNIFNQMNPKEWNSICSQQIPRNNIYSKIEWNSIFKPYSSNLSVIWITCSIQMKIAAESIAIKCQEHSIQSKNSVRTFNE